MTMTITLDSDKSKWPPHPRHLVVYKRLCASLMIAPVSRSHADATVESFRNDPDFAASYLDAILEDGDETELLQALRRVAKAFGGVGEVAAKAHLHSKTLYRTLSPEGNPEMKTLVAVLRAMGLRLSVKPLAERGRIPV